MSDSPPGRRGLKRQAPLTVLDVPNLLVARIGNECLDKIPAFNLKAHIMCAFIDSHLGDWLVP